MMVISKKDKKVAASELKPISNSQVKRLSSVTGIAAKKISGLSIAEISDKFKFEIDRTLLFYRQVCGQVVKTDPATGISFPVPFATVYVEDTDCNLLSYTPLGSPHLWYFPFLCRTEEIATTVTDECGRFCVNIPRWEIDWILKWRKERICFPEIFVRPRIKDILDDIFQRIPEPFPPEPQPDPIPWRLRDGGPALERARDALGSSVVETIAQLAEGASFGEPATALQHLLEGNAFSKSIPPPLPAEISNGVNLCGKFADYGKLEKETLKTLSAEIKVTPELAKSLSNIQMDRYIGPFRRCFDVYIPQWSLIFDVPDITFRVTQDVDGDGDEETIYSENLFDVRWNSGSIPDVTLEASEIALSAETCHPPTDFPCEEPAIVMAGLMPLHNPPADPVPYHDQNSGYAKRPNRPHPTGGFAVPPLPSPPPANLLASAPLTRTLQLYGCNEHAGAEYYRLRYTFNGSAPQTFTGHSWKVFRWVGSPGHLEVRVVAPDGNGWYEVLPVADQWLPSHLLLSWPTRSYQNGLYDVSMELGNNSKAVIHTTPEIGLRVDNTWDGNNEAGAVAHFTTLKWRHLGESESEWRSLLVSCPVVRRDSGKDVEIAVGIEVAAPHLRSIKLWGSGCGGTHPELTSSLPGNWESYLINQGMQHWHTTALDNSFNNTLAPSIFRLAGSSQSGVYSFHLHAHSRAFNPAGSDAGFGLDWHYNPVYNWRHPNVHIAVVDS